LILGNCVGFIEFSMVIACKEKLVQTDLAPTKFREDEVENRLVI